MKKLRCGRVELDVQTLAVACAASYRIACIAAVLVSLYTVFPARGHAADAPVLWFAPLDPFPRPWPIRGPGDYFSLFEPSSPWPVVRQHVSVFKIYPQFPGKVSTAQLRALMDFLSTNNIKLALETGVLTWGPHCGDRMIESYGGQYIAGAAKLIQRAGGRIDFLAMDEPLWFGGHYPGPNRCRTTIENLAEDAARNVRAVRQIFPGIEVGDIEPAPATEVAGWDTDELLKWARAYATASGHPLSFMHIDVQWQRRWQEPMRHLAQELRRANIPLGVIYNGTPQDANDEDFARNAREHYIGMENALGQPPSHIIFQSWRSFPTRALPEDDPLTITGIARGYLRYRNLQRPN